MDKIHYSDDCFGVVTRERVKIFATASRMAEVVGYANWMGGYFVIDTQVDINDIKFVRIAAEDQSGNLIPQGWLQATHFLTRHNPLKTNGIREKAILLNYENNRPYSKSIALLKSPSRKAVETEYTGSYSSVVSYVYDVHYNRKEKQKYLLIGSHSRITYLPQDVILGWVPSDRVLEWNTRYAAEYDKSTLDSRSPVRILYSLNDWATRIVSNEPLEPENIVALEDESQKEMGYHSPRLLIIDGEKQIKGHRIWRVGAFYNSIDDHLTDYQNRDTNNHLISSNEIEVMILYEGDIALQKFSLAVTSALTKLQLHTDKMWLEKYPNQLQPVIRVASHIFSNSHAKSSHNRLTLSRYAPHLFEDFFTGAKFEKIEQSYLSYDDFAHAISDSMSRVSKSSLVKVILLADLSKPFFQDQKAAARFASHIKAINGEILIIHIGENSNALVDTNHTSIKKSLVSSGISPINISNKTAETDLSKLQGFLYSNLLKLVESRFNIQHSIKTSGHGVVRKRVSSVGTLAYNTNLNGHHSTASQPPSFSTGWTMPEDLDSGERALKMVVLMRRDEVELLVSTLGQLVWAGKKGNIGNEWKQALREVTGNTIDVYESHSVADILTAFAGIQVKNIMLNTPLVEIEQLSDEQKIDSLLDIKRKLFRLRAVVNEMDIKIVSADDFDAMTFEKVGEKRYWFGDNNSLQVWLDAEEYMP